MAGRRGTIEVKLVSSGADRTRRDVDGVANSLGKLGKDVDRTANQAGRGLDRIGGGFSRLAASAGPLAGINPVLGHLTTGLDSFGTKLSAVESGAAGAGGALSGKLAAGASIATTALVATAAVGVGKFLQITGQVRAFQRVTGASAEEASKLVYVMHALGIDSDAAARGMFFLARSADTKKLHDFGVTVARNKDGSADLGETLLRVSDAYNATNDSTKRADIVAAAFGARMGAQFIPILARGRDGLAELNAEAEKTGLVFKQDQLDQAKNFGLAMREVEASTSGLAIGLANGVVPAVTALANVLVPIIEFLNKTHVLSAALAALLARQLVVWLVAGAEASWAFVAGLIKIDVSAIGTTAGVTGMAGAMEAEAVAATSAAGATSLLDAAMGGLPLILGLVVGGLTLFSSHNKDATAAAGDYQKAIEAQTGALGDNAAALAANSRSALQSTLQNKGVIDDLAKAGLTIDDVQKAVTGSAGDYKKFDNALFNNKNASSALADAIYALRQQFLKGKVNVADLAAVGGVLDAAMDANATSLDKASSAVDRFNATLASGVDAAANARSAHNTLVTEQEKLNQVMAENPADVHAQKLEELGKAERDVTNAHQARADALAKLHEVESRSVEDERQRLSLARDQAAFDEAQAQRELEKRRRQVDRLVGAGRGGNELRDARDAVTEQGLAVRTAHEQTTSAQTDLDSVATQHARDLREARDAVASATDAEADAQRHLSDARKAAIPLSEEVAKHNRDIADQLDRVVKAAGGEWSALLAGGFVTSNQAAQGLLGTLQSLGPLVQNNPALAAILGAAITNAPQPEDYNDRRPYHPGGGLAVAAEGGIAHRQMVRFAEPQTGGEAFIPRLGINSARGRALADIAASWHGGRVVPMASGGVVGPLGEVRVQVVHVPVPERIEQPVIFGEGSVGVRQDLDEVIRAGRDMARRKRRGRPSGN